MDGATFDRITKTLARGGVRRQALRGIAGGVLMATASRLGLEAATKKKKPCQKLAGICGSGIPACCGQAPRRVSCEEPTKRGCGPGKRCCTFEAFECHPAHGDCDCCGDLHCGFIGFLGWRCLRPPRDNG